MARNRWMAEHFSDPYVKRAQAQGYRSRAAFKLEEIDARDHVLRAGDLVADLGSAPGGFAQYAARRVGPGGRVVAVDILPMAPLSGVDFIQGDFTDPACLAHVRAALGGPADLVISDMAPNISGIAAADQAHAMGLAEMALEFAAACLAAEGRCLIKAFQGAGFPELLAEMRRRFSRVATRKPPASRPRSPEVYLLGTGLRPVVPASES